MAYTSLALAAIIALVTLIYAYKFRWRFPMWDDWDILTSVFSPMEGDPSLIWRLWLQHNEHRILVVRSVFALDYIYFKGHGLFNVTYSIIQQALSFGTLCLWIRQSKFHGDLSRPLVISIYAVCLSFIFTFVACEDYTRESGIFTVTSMTFLAFYSLWLAKNNARWILLTCFCGAVATSSMGQGLFLWPFLIVASLLNKNAKKTTIPIVVMFVILAFFYFHNYFFPERSASPVDNILNFKNLLVYWFTFTQSIQYHNFAAFPNFEKYIFISLGSLSLILGAGTAWQYWKQKLYLDQWINFTILMLLYFLFISVVAAITRSHFGSVQAIATRYMITSSLIWVLFYILLSRVALKSTRPVVIFLGLILVLSQARLITAAFVSYSYRNNLKLISGLSLYMNSYDPELIALFPTGRRVRNTAKSLKDSGVSVFNSPTYNNLVKNLPEDLNTLGRCPLIGYELSHLKSSSGIRISGRLFVDHLPNFGPLEVTLFDESQKYIGSAFVAAPEFPLKYSFPDNEPWDFFGYLNKIPTTLTVYVSHKKAAFCILQNIEVPKTR